MIDALEHCTARGKPYAVFVYCYSFDLCAMCMRFLFCGDIQNNNNNQTHISFYDRDKENWC